MLGKMGPQIGKHARHRQRMEANYVERAGYILSRAFIRHILDETQTIIQQTPTEPSTAITNLFRPQRPGIAAKIPHVKWISRRYFQTTGKCEDKSIWVLGSQLSAQEMLSCNRTGLDAELPKRKPFAFMHIAKNAGRFSPSNNHRFSVIG